jgi:hypothetical protein
MKKTILSLTAALLTLSALAQEDGAGPDIQKVRFGAYIAPNLSWMHPTAGKSDDGQFSVKSDGSKIGYSWGLVAEYFFTENYGLATGFQLNTTGGKISTANTSDLAFPLPKQVISTDFDYTVQYLEVPFALKLRTDDIGGLRFFGQIGLSMGFNIGKKASYAVAYNDETGTPRTLSGEKEKLVGSLTMAPVMLQLNVGGGLEFPLSGKLSLYTGLFFNNGFLPDATRPDKFGLGYEGSFTDGNIRLNNLSLRVGLLF